MSVKTFAAAALLAVLAAALVAQPFPVRLYGGSGSEECHAMVEGADMGFCLAGWTRSYGPPGSSNILVVKTDPLGYPLWARVSIGEADEEARAMTATMDQCYAVAGWTRSYGMGIPNSNIFIMKLDGGGNMLWGRVYGGFQDDQAFSIVQTRDSGYALTGLTHGFGPAPMPNIFVLKLDKQGIFQWMRAYWIAPTHVVDEGYSIVQTPDMGYAVCGRANALGPVLHSPFLLKLDPMGLIQWVYVSGANYSDEAYSVAVDLAGDILVAGRTLSFGTAPGTFHDMFVAKFTVPGMSMWSQTYGWSTGDEEVWDDRSLTGTQDGGSCVCGPTTSVGPGIPSPNFMVLKLDPLGMPMWCRSHPSSYDPGFQSDVPLPMVELAAGGYAVAGWTDSYTHLLGASDFMLSTFDFAGNRPVCAEPQDPLVMEMPWFESLMKDTFCMPEFDTIFVVPVDVLLDSICYEDTTGIGEQGAVPGTNGFAVRAQGRGIELTLDRPTVVEIRLFTPAGRQAWQAGRTEYAAGRHEIRLPVDIAKGAYIVSLSARGRQAFTKLVRF